MRMFLHSYNNSFDDYSIVIDFEIREHDASSFVLYEDSSGYMFFMGEVPYQFYICVLYFFLFFFNFILFLNFT